MDLTTVTGLRRARTRADLALAPGEALLAGGTWLFSEPQPAVTGLVDLTGMGWPAWEVRPDGLRIGATCTVEELAAAPWGDAAELVRRCTAAFLMSFKLQHVATVGGNLCLALPAAAMVSLTVALDGVAVIWTPDGGERRVPVIDFVTGPGTTALRRGEVLRAVDVPVGGGSATDLAFRKVALSPLGRSSAVVIGRRTDDALTVTVTAATERPVALRFPGPPTAGELAGAVDGIDCWFDDPHGPADWRAHVTGVLAAEVREELAR